MIKPARIVTAEHEDALEDPHKKRVVLRMDPDLYDRLVALADGEYRSLHGQVLWLIQDALVPAEEARKDRVERTGR